MEFSVNFSVQEEGKNRPEYTLQSDLRGEVSLADFLKFTKTSLIVIADEVLTDEQTMGFDKTPVVVVDGSQKKKVIDVDPLGQIEFVSRAAIDTILLDTYQALLDRSPVLSGEYKDSHYVFLNGTQIATNISELQTWLKNPPDLQQKDLFRFVDIQPYARKLERLGVTAQRQQSRTVQSRDHKRKKTGGRVLAPNGVYFLTARSIRAKYKQNSVIKFDFISGSTLGLTQGGGGVTHFKKGRNSKPSRTYLYPTITISVQESGLV